jgi:hypothetical protein
MNDIAKIKCLATTPTEFAGMQKPSLGNPPSEDLPPPVKGYKCWTDPATCTYSSGELSDMDTHCKTSHKKPGKETKPDWKYVDCQYFEIEGMAPVYFEVTLAPHAANTQANELRELGKTWKAKYQRVAGKGQEEERKQFTPKYDIHGHKMWLTVRGIASRTQGFDISVLMKLGAGPGNPDEQLLLLCRGVIGVVRHAQQLAVGSKIGAQALKEINKKVACEEGSELFDAKIDEQRLIIYVQWFQRVLMYIWRCETLQDARGHPVYATTREQKDAREVTRLAIVGLCQRNAEGVPSTDNAESESEHMGKIGQAIADWCKSLFAQRCKENDLEGPLISALTVLAATAGDEWNTAIKYAEILPGIIHIGRLIVIYTAFHEREQRVKTTTLSDKGESQIAPSCYELIKRDVDTFMTFSSDGGTWAPMECCFRTLSSAWKVIYGTDRSRKCQLQEGKFQIGEERFELWQVKEMVRRVNQGGAMMLFGNIMGLPAKGDDWDRSTLPTIDWDNIKDDASNTRPGYSFMVDQRNDSWEGGDQCQWLLDRILRRISGRTQYWDGKRLSVKFITEMKGHIEKLQTYLCMAGQLNSAPGKGWEILSCTWKNGSQGEKRTSGIDNGLFYLVTHYDKNWGGTGETKLVYRYLPREVGELFVYYLVVVRPLWDAILAMTMNQYNPSTYIFDVAPEKSKEWEEDIAKNRGADAQRDRSTVAEQNLRTWTTERAERHLRRAMITYLNIPSFGVFGWRKVAAACMQTKNRVNLFDEGDIYEGGTHDGRHINDVESDAWAGIPEERTSTNEENGYSLSWKFAREDLGRQNAFREASRVFHNLLGWPSASTNTGQKRSSICLGISDGMEPEKKKTKNKNNRSQIVGSRVGGRNSVVARANQENLLRAEEDEFGTDPELEDGMRTIEEPQNEQVISMETAEKPRGKRQNKNSISTLGREDSCDMAKFGESIEFWKGKCPICSINVDGSVAGISTSHTHSMGQCEKDEALKIAPWANYWCHHEFGGEFWPDDYTCCKECGVPQDFCNRFTYVNQGRKKFEWDRSGKCDLEGLLAPVVAAMTQLKGHKMNKIWMEGVVGLMLQEGETRDSNWPEDRDPTSWTNEESKMIEEKMMGWLGGKGKCAKTKIEYNNLGWMFHYTTTRITEIAQGE